MREISLQRIRKFHKFVFEPEEVVAQCEMWIEGPKNDDPLKFRVKVLRTEKGEYIGVPSHRIGNYVSLHSQPTIQQAVEDALSGLSAWYNPKKPIRKQLTPYEDY